MSRGQDTNSTRIGVDTPGHHSLRRGRKSLDGWTYMVTICVNRRQPLLALPGAPEAVAGVLAAMHARDDRDVDAYVIMPDHLHLLMKVRGGSGLPDALRELKSLAARAVNAELDREGPVWQRGYHDRAVRCYEEYQEHLRYIWENPVRAGVVARPEEYPWVSVKGMDG